MKRPTWMLLFAFVLAVAVSSFMLIPVPILMATPSDGNQVFVFFLTDWVHEVDGDSFNNAEVTGQRQWRISEIVNTPDETGEPVRELRVTLDSDLAFDWINRDSSVARPGTLIRTGPPTYEWSFGDLAEAPEHLGQVFDAYVGFIQPTSTRVSPGFDLSRSFDKTMLTAPDTQTMTITVTPREEWVKKVNFSLSTWENELVDPVFTSVTGGEVSPDGRCADIANIPVELNTPVTVTVISRVNPKVPKVEYKPIVRVHVDPPMVPIQGTSTGSSFSYTDEVGTWTVSAEGSYVWRWTAHSSPKYAVTLGPRAEQPGADEDKGSKSQVPLNENPASVPPAPAGISWPVAIGIAVGVVVVALAMYVPVRRRRKRARM